MMYFLGLSNELIRLVDIDEKMPIKNMKNILDQGYDPIDCLEKISDYKTCFPLSKYFDKEEDNLLRNQIMESLVQYYENYGHKMSIQKNGLLYLSEICNRIVASEYYLHIEKKYCFFGAMPLEELNKVKRGILIDNKEKYPNGSNKEY